MPKVGGNTIEQCMEICMSDTKTIEEYPDPQKRSEVCYAACMGSLEEKRVHESVNEWIEKNRFNVSVRDGKYIINGEENPTITLVRGKEYSFYLNAEGHPFFIKTEQSTGDSGRYDNGIVNNGTQTALLSFDVPMNAPERLYYNCSFHETMRGVIEIINEEQMKLIDLVNHYKITIND
jgi:hypothetical protein